MGANSKQGWCLFVFLVGFAFLVAGLAYLGTLFALAGLACLVASLVGFHRIKPLEVVHAHETPTRVAPMTASAKQRHAS